MELKTARLTLCRPRLADVPALFEFLEDKAAMRHTNVDASLRTCRRLIAVHERRRRRDGYAPWTVLTRAEERIVGWGGLYDDPFARAPQPNMTASSSRGAKQGSDPDLRSAGLLRFARNDGVDGPLSRHRCAKVGASATNLDGSHR